MFASVAFLFALVAAFASKNVSSADTLDQYYVKNGIACQPTDCDPSNTGSICTFTVYEDDLLNPCSTAIVAYRP